MKLVKAKVKKFRNFVDSDIVEIEDSITSLIGKNESGKSAFLKALYSIKPDNPNESPIQVILDYPRWLKVHDVQKNHLDLDEVSYVEAYFSLNDSDLSNLTEILNVPIPKNPELCIERNYNGNLHARLEFVEGIEVNEADWIKALLDSGRVEDEIKKLMSPKTIDEINQILHSKIEDKKLKIENLNSQIQSKISKIQSIEEEKSQAPEESWDKIDERVSKVQDEKSQIEKEISPIQEEINKFNDIIGMLENIRSAIENTLLNEKIDEIIEMVPTFFYYNQYSTLKGRIDLEDLKTKDSSSISKTDQTSKALLKLVGVNESTLMNNEYEFRKAELEAAAIGVTRRVLTYWTQNEDLNVDLDVDPEIVNGKPVHRFLDVRLKDQRGHTTNFKTRSTGFQWFFSFIVAFSEFEDKNDVIILLDEPGLGLHGKAQEDLLKFVENELADGRQVIYTNHSPSMVNPKQLERVRLVEDNLNKPDIDFGSKISAEVLDVKRPETLFPLQAAFGYDIAQNLFIGPYNLVVEGPSDYLYLDLLSEHLKEKERTYLNEKIIIVPVGGADKIPTFIALLGIHLDLTVLVDSNMEHNQKIQDMITAGLLKEKRFVTVGQIINNPSADIEDLFTVDDYLRLYNKAFSVSISANDLVGTDSIIKRLERFTGNEFNHYKPLNVLQKNPEELNKLSDDTLKNFEKIFDALNKTFNEK